MKVIKKMVGAGYKLLGMPYYIIKYVIKNIYKVFKLIPSYVGKGIDLIINFIKKLVIIVWNPFKWIWKLIKKIKPTAILKWLYDVLKESVAQIFTLLGFYIAWFTLTGTAQDIVGIAIIISTAIWLLTIRWRDSG